MIWLIRTEESTVRECRRANPDNDRGRLSRYIRGKQGHKTRHNHDRRDSDRGRQRFFAITQSNQQPAPIPRATSTPPPRATPPRSSNPPTPAASATTPSSIRAGADGPPGEPQIDQRGPIIHPDRERLVDRRASADNANGPARPRRTDEQKRPVTNDEGGRREEKSRDRRSTSADRGDRHRSRSRGRDDHGQQTHKAE